MDEPDHNSVAGIAALSICESLLIALVELKIITEKEGRSVLLDAAESHRKAIPDAGGAKEHRAVAELIEFGVRVEFTFALRAFRV